MTNEQRGDRSSRIMDIILERCNETDQEIALQEFLQGLLYTGWFTHGNLVRCAAFAVEADEGGY